MSSNKQKMVRKEVRIPEKRLLQIEEQMVYFGVESQASYLRELLDIGYMVKQKQMEGGINRLSDIEIDGHISSILSHEMLKISMGMGSSILSDLTQQSIEMAQTKLYAIYDITK